MPLKERGGRDGEARESVDWVGESEADGVGGEDVCGEGPAAEAEPGVDYESGDEGEVIECLCGWVVSVCLC